MADLCPLPTMYAQVNIDNHLRCIKLAALGPADPRQPSDAFWQDKMKKWKVQEGQARSQLCMNCEHYIATSEMMNCVAKGSGAKIKASNLPVTPKWADIPGMPSAVCNRYNITCSALRTCDDWEAGGPITDSNMNSDMMEG